jgi:tRNA pseudouridine38-40 synthase
MLFLQHQVRNMIGALIYVGKGAHPPGYIKELLQKRDRTLSPPTFSPCGLYLTGVGYDEKWGLPAGSLPDGLHVLI